MPSLNHIHTLRRVRATRDSEYFLYMCQDPHCTFKSEKSFLLGKASLCNICRREFILTMQDLRRAKPICKECSNTEEAREFRRKRDTIKNLFGEKEETVEQ